MMRSALQELFEKYTGLSEKAFMKPVFSSKEKQLFGTIMDWRAKKSLFTLIIIILISNISISF